MSVLGTHLYQCNSWRLLWEVVLTFSEFFLKSLSAGLPISQWMIYKHSCLHSTECSAVFDQKWHDPCAPPFLFTWSHPKWLFFCFTGWKKSSKGNILPMWDRWNKKMAEALKGIRIDKFQTALSGGKKCLGRCIASDGEYFEGDWSLNG